MIDATSAPQILRELHANSGSWKRVEQDLGINRGLLWKVANWKVGAPKTVVDALRRNAQSEGDRKLIKEIRERVVPWMKARLERGEE